ncbi:MAG: hypothetical protein WAM85_19060 [Terracidiphilus sp.]
MNTPTQNAQNQNSDYAGEAEKTLRLIAGLPAPEGLEERVKAALRDAPRNGRILRWPSELDARRGWTHSSVLRCAAAAAIVFVVAGGGWGVYSRVQPTQSAKVIAMPRVAAPGGFSNAGAMRTPQTLNGTVLKHPMKATNQPSRNSARTDRKANHHSRAGAAGSARK